MDRATANLILRMLGSASLALLLVHGGQDLERRPAPWAFVLLWVIVATAANWALARLNVKRAALWTTLVLLGAVPALMPALHYPEMGSYDARYLGVLYGLSALGVATSAMALWMLRPAARTAAA